MAIPGHCPHATAGLEGSMVSSLCWNRSPLSLSARGRRRHKTRDFPVGARTPPRAHERPNLFFSLQCLHGAQLSTNTYPRRQLCSPTANATPTFLQLAIRCMQTISPAMHATRLTQPSPPAAANNLLNTATNTCMHAHLASSRADHHATNTTTTHAHPCTQITHTSTYSCLAYS